MGRQLREKDFDNVFVSGLGNGQKVKSMQMEVAKSSGSLFFDGDFNVRVNAND